MSLSVDSKRWVSSRALLQEKDTPYAELRLSEAHWTDGELIDFIQPLSRRGRRKDPASHGSGDTDFRSARLAAAGRRSGYA